MKEQFAVTMYVAREIIYKPKLGALESISKKYDALMNQLSSCTYNDTDFGDSILEFGASLIPQYRYSGLSTVQPFLIRSVLANAGITISVEMLINSMPSKDTIQNLVTKNVIDTCILTQESVRKDMNAYLSPDKGN